MKETKGGPDAKLPAGTPMLNVQFRISEGEHENRRVFRSYVIAPAKIKDPETGRNVNNENKKVTDGILYGFLKAVGFDPDELKSGDFNLDFDELSGRPVRVKVGTREWNGQTQNDVKDVKADNGEPTTESDDLSTLSI
jgi:hypothetical protein